MKGKILMSVRVAQVAQDIEVWVPTNLRFAEINKLTSQVATTLTNGQFRPSQQVLLCDATSGKPFALNKTPHMVGLGNGAKAILI